MISITHEQRQLLREIRRKQQSTRQLQGDRDFASVKRDMDSLEESGFIRYLGGNKIWQLTAAGWSATSNCVVPSRTFVNYSQTDTYTLPVWRNNRAGSNAHQSIASRGFSC